MYILQQLGTQTLTGLSIYGLRTLCPAVDLLYCLDFFGSPQTPSAFMAPPPPRTHTLQVLIFFLGGQGFWAVAEDPALLFVAPPPPPPGMSYTFHLHLHNNVLKPLFVLWRLGPPTQIVLIVSSRRGQH